MIIGIDFDHTWTADMDLWKEFVNLAHKRGHKCIIVTSRYDYGEEKILVESAIQGLLPIIYTNKVYNKCNIASQAGYNVDIWIEDSPWMVGKKEESK